MTTTPEPDVESADPRKQYAGLIDEFGNGWQTGSAERMAGVFTDDAVFRPDPFARDVKGREAIAEYWDDIPRQQAEISFRFGEIFSVGPWFSTEFRCTFRRRRTGEWIDVRGALFCETADGRISEMRMYVDRQVGASGG